MTNEQAIAFAEHWVAAWNRLDVEAILSHYTDGVVFVSPTAALVVGTPRVEGKPALRAYWVAAVQKLRSLAFTLDHVTWDPVRRVLVIVYVSTLAGSSKRAAELFRFDEHDRVVAGEAFYGAPYPP